MKDHYIKTNGYKLHNRAGAPKRAGRCGWCALAWIVAAVALCGWFFTGAAYMRYVGRQQERYRQQLALAEAAQKAGQWEASFTSVAVASIQAIDAWPNDKDKLAELVRLWQGIVMEASNVAGPETTP